MKKIYLLLCLLPLLASAQYYPYDSKFPHILLDSRSSTVSTFANSDSSFAPLDSAHVYDDRGDLLLFKYTYEYDGYNIVSRKERGYSNNVDLFQVNTTFLYEDYKYLWSQQLDSIFQDNTYMSREKITREFNEETYLTYYREYNAFYDSPWEEPYQVYVAVDFNEKNMPIVFMDTMMHVKVDPLTGKSEKVAITRKWEVTYSSDFTIKTMTCLTKPESEWIEESKYVISYDQSGLKRTIEAFIKSTSMEWTLVHTAVRTVDARNHITSWIGTSANGLSYQSYRTDLFYNETAMHNEEISDNNGLRIQLNNSSRTLTVDLQEEQKGEVTIVTPAGRVVMRQSVNQAVSTLSLNNLQAGYYIISVKTAKEYKSQAVILR